MSTELKSESAKKNEDWMNSKWRPMMGWMYMLVCTADFVVFPVLWSLVQATSGGQVHSQWNPITLQGAGLFHMAMGAILGIAAYGRTQEKLGDKAGGTMAVPATPAPSFSAPAPTTNSFGGSNSFSSPAPVSSNFGSPAVTASGKKIVPAADEPLL